MAADFDDNGRLGLADVDAPLRGRTEETGLEDATVLDGCYTFTQARTQQHLKFALLTLKI